MRSLAREMYWRLAPPLPDDVGMVPYVVIFRRALGAENLRVWLSCRCLNGRRVI